jgi:serine/threonine protein kinase
MDRIGRFKIVRELGRGAMGVVYHAIDPNIGRPVAIKTIQLGGGRKPEEQERLRERLFREARSAGMLSHPGIVTVYDVEQQGDLAYIAMEYVDGPTLDQLLAEHPPIGPEKLFSVLAQTAAALDYAHQRGIVHRDIKPANVMIAQDGTAKITDFGIAKITTSDQFTMTGTIVGTPHYMSPEQVQGHAVDGRADQFSLAVIAYEALTGEKPYTGEHLTTVVYKIVTEEPAAPHRLNPTLSPAIDAVLAKALSKKPEARYRTCQEFIDALEKACNETRGWKLMARGGGLNEPTLVEKEVERVGTDPGGKVTLPRAVRPQRLGDTTVTSGREGGRKSGLLTFLLATLVAGGLLALIGFQAAPWLGAPAPSSQTSGDQAKQQPPPPAAAPESSPSAPQAGAPASNPAAAAPAGTAGTGATASTAPPAAEEPAPNGSAAPQNPAPESEARSAAPAPPPAKKARAAESDKPSALAPPVRETTRRTARPMPAEETTQPVTIITSPAGATATMDGRSDAECRTPCTLDAAPGRHSLAVVLPGHQVEHREFDVGSSPLELPAVVLRAPGGTLLISSVPSGAAILVNGQSTGKTTPAQLTLSPGSYRITVEHDGKQVSQVVQVRSGISYLKIPLNP